MCPCAVGRTWIAGRETPSSHCRVSKASLRILADLKFAYVSVVWDARRKFKDLENTWKLSRGIFLAGACVLLSFFLDGEVERPGGQVDFSLSEDC